MQPCSQLLAYFEFCQRGGAILEVFPFPPLPLSPPLTDFFSHLLLIPHLSFYLLIPSPLLFNPRCAYTIVVWGTKAEYLLCGWKNLVTVTQFT